MCRYAMYGPYKTHHACFACRKAFKQPSIEDYLAVRGRGFAYKELIRLWSNKTARERREEKLEVRLAELQAEFRDAIVQEHITYRVRRWLRRKFEVKGNGYRQFPDSYLERTLGLLNLTSFQPSDSWTKP